MGMNLKSMIFKLSGKSVVTKSLLYQYRITAKWPNRIPEREFEKWEEHDNLKQKYLSNILKRGNKKDQLLLEECKTEIRKFPVRQELNDKKKKFSFISDMIFCYRSYGVSPNEYLLFEYWKKSPDERKAFITDLNRYEYYYWMNDPYVEKILFDKYKTWERYKTFMGRDMLKITPDIKEEKIIDFIKKHTRFVVKPLDLSRGEGVKAYQYDGTNMKKLLAEVKGFKKCILEELIIQVKEMGRLHPQSVNTVRCPTVYTREGGSVFHPVFRMGRGGSFVDNAAAGGIIANIDTETGIVISDGVDESGNHYQIHPDSKIQIKGFQIPKWNELLCFANKIASVMPEVRYVGWDMALTEKGWVMIEGNCHGQFLCEYVDQIGRKAEMDELQQRI